MICFFDTETSGFGNDAWIVQLAWIIQDEVTRQIYTEANFIIKGNGRPMPEQATAAHGITTEMSELGLSEEHVFSTFLQQARHVDLLVCHNFAFDNRMLKNNLNNSGFDSDYIYLTGVPNLCTMQISKDFCQLPKKNGGLKPPKLEELHKILFGYDFENVHDALADVRATMKCYWALKAKGII